MESSTERNAACVPELNEREMFALRCLNAAVNLYGILTVDECVRLYNHYAKGKPAPVSDEMTVEELENIVAHAKSVTAADRFDLPFDQMLDAPECWFELWQMGANMPAVIVYYDFLAGVDGVADPTNDEIREVSRRIAKTVADFEKLDLNILPEDEFFDYEEPSYAEETKEAKKFSDFLQDEYYMTRDDADCDVCSIQSHARINGSSLVVALRYIRDECDWRPHSHDDLTKLFDVVIPVLSTTRLWRGRGRTVVELYDLGIGDDIQKEAIPNVFGIDGMGTGEIFNTSARDNNDDYDDDYEDEEDEGDPILPEDIPLSVYNGPIDFKFVKDPVKREAKLAVYENVQQVVDDFYTDYFIDECPSNSSETTDARFGLAKENGGRFPPEFSLFLSEFTLLLDDEAKETPCQKVLAKRDDFDEIDSRAATYYENFRFTCLEILAVKAGVGVKCRDLLTGEDLFLMEKSFSQGDVKGVILFASIAPMEDVYISVGNILPLPRENARAIFNRALDQAGIPSKCPIRLSFDQQRKLAAETIKAYVALRGA
jgi:hypothetical protein